jgi:hypothetical protein
VARSKIKLDHDGIAEVLLWPALQADVLSAARTIASNAQHTTKAGVTLPVSVIARSGGRDRVGAVVAIAHPAGAAVEAKYGVLSRAASAAGFPVSGGGDRSAAKARKSGKSRTGKKAEKTSYTTASGKTVQATAAQILAWGGASAARRAK